MRNNPGPRPRRRLSPACQADPALRTARSRRPSRPGWCRAASSSSSTQPAGWRCFRLPPLADEMNPASSWPQVRPGRAPDGRRKRAQLDTGFSTADQCDRYSCNTSALALDCMRVPTRGAHLLDDAAVGRRAGRPAGRAIHLGRYGRRELKTTVSSRDSRGQLRTRWPPSFYFFLPPLAAALPPLGFLAPPLLPGPLSGIWALLRHPW
jgi:hypothetical protein